jgi:hypothetical protein
MKTVFARTPTTPQLDDDAFVPEELIGRLHRASETTIADLLDRFTPQERANLAMFCYHKAHLRKIGLALAATCDLPTLVSQWGSVLGHTIFAQSRDGGAPLDAVRLPNRPKVTLASSAGGYWPPFVEIDDADAPATA